jgi:ABC-type branched-subunit amino acid transport system ATPase component
MATDPFMLLLDEPAAGMNPQETQELDELIINIRETEGISILLIEHDMKLVMSLSDRIFVMDYGKKIAQGTPKRSAKIRPSSRPISERKSMLSLVDIHTFYGNIQALKGVSLEVKEGEIITLIGANGAGKTTTLMSISGIVPPRSGDIRFMGNPSPG